jgi:peptidoglycan/LPS O-acetylase OafA/YrhL
MVQNAPIVGGRRAERPIVLGTEYTNVVGWFFVVLAVVRVLAYLLSWRWGAFVLAVVIAVAAIVASERLGLPDNLYEWRHWPAALLMFMLGTRLARTRRIPHWLGLTAAAAGLALPLANRPGLWAEGFLPLYAAQEVAALVGLLWLAGLLARTPLAHALAWVCHRSLPLLVLHGWVILSVYGLVVSIVVPSMGAWLLLAVFAANTALHLLLYRLLAKPLGLFFSACSATSRKLGAACRSL